MDEHNVRIMRVTRKRVTGWLALCSCGMTDNKVRFKKSQALRKAAEHVASREDGNGLLIPEKE